MAEKRSKPERCRKTLGRALRCREPKVSPISGMWLSRGIAASEESRIAVRRHDDERALFHAPSTSSTTTAVYLTRVLEVETTPEMEG